ncbi:MAG TPA: ATP-binding protein [Methylobacter sp.]|jgi:PAS domain S-box-containing protein
MNSLLQSSAHSPDFRRRFFWNSDVIFIVVLMIVGATLSWVAYDEYRQAQESEYRLLEAHARNADLQIVEALAEIVHVLNRVARQIAVVQQGKQPLQDMAFAAVLERYGKDATELSTLWLTDADGRIHTATDAAIIGRDVSDEPYFTAHIGLGQTPNLFMSRPDKKLLGVTAVIFTLPIVSADRQLLGIVGATIGYSFFPSVLQAINPADSASMSVIFNRDGDLLFRRENPEKFFGNNITKVSTVLQEHFNAGTQVTRHIGPSAHDDKTRLFLVRDVSDTGLSLILSRQLSEVIAVWRRNVVIYALIFLFTTVVVVVLALVAARRKKLEETQIEILSHLQKIASQVPGVVYQYRLHPDGHSSLPFASEAIREIFGVSPEEVREDASKIFALVHPDDYHDLIASIQKSAQDLSRWQHEFRVRFDDGTVHWLLGNSLPQQEADGVVLWHGFITSITERKRMEEELIAAKHQAEDASLAKSKFFAAASHDLRQPIHAQGLFLGVLSRTELTEQQREMLASASAASDAAAEMLNTLLDFSRIEAGVVEPQLLEFRLQTLFNKIEREFMPQADAKGLSYRSRETALMVQSDPALLELILRNLVSNAIRYTERGGLLVACRKRGDQAMLEVWDTGIGVAPAHQKEVFHEFHQLGNPERDNRKGLGLGLAIAEGLARTLGHGLWLTSILQRGSVFRLALPIATEALSVEPVALDYGKARSLNVSVLVIDDDEAVCVGMFHLLRDWGCECDAAGSIEDALELAVIHPPDLVISDYRLREQRTGLEAIAALRALLGNNLPALLITGDTAPDRLREAQAGRIPVLHKPVSPSELYRGLVTVLGQTEQWETVSYEHNESCIEQSL